MLNNDIVLERGQIFFEDDSNDNIVLFRQHRIEAVVGDQLAVARVQPDGTELLMLYTKAEFYEQMSQEEPTLDD